MSCGCGGAKKAQFKVDAYILDGWYYIDLCENYKLKLRRWIMRFLQRHKIMM